MDLKINLLAQFSQKAKIYHRQFANSEDWARV